MRHLYSTDAIRYEHGQIELLIVGMRDTVHLSSEG